MKTNSHSANFAILEDERSSLHNLDSLLQKVFEQNLTKPVMDFLNRPCKQMRMKLVDLGWQLSRAQNADHQRHQVKAMAKIIESIHAASLIIDDIQDDSHERRGRPAMHIMYGVPLAINMGNWLYFWSLEQIHQQGFIIQNPQLELLITKAWHKVMLEAHLEQTLDLAIAANVWPAPLIEKTYLTTIDLKTGALMGLALKIGGLIGNYNDIELHASLESLGRHLGKVFQIYNDLESLLSCFTKDFKAEDYIKTRITWIWVIAARNLEEQKYQKFMKLIISLKNDDVHDHHRISFLQFLEENQLLLKAREDFARQLQNLQIELEQNFNKINAQAMVIFEELMAVMKRVLRCPQ